MENQNSRNDRFGAWLRRVFGVREQLDTEALLRKPPSDLEIRRAVLNEAINNLDKLGLMFRGMLTLREEVAKLSSLDQAVEERQKRLVELDKGIAERSDTLDRLKGEVKLALGAHEQIVDSLARIRGEQEADEPALGPYFNRMD